MRLEAQSDEREVERFTELIVASLTPLNRKGVNQILSFLTSIEGDLAYCLPRLAQQYDVMPILADLAKKTPDDRRPDFEDGVDATSILNPRSRSLLANKSLLGLLNILRELSDASPELRQSIDRGIGTDWRRSIRNISELRNAYAHGRLVDLLTAGRFTENVVQVFDWIVIAIRVQVGVEKIRERLIGQESDNYSNIEEY